MQISKMQFRIMIVFSFASLNRSVATGVYGYLYPQNQPK